MERNAIRFFSDVRVVKMEVSQLRAKAKKKSTFVGSRHRALRTFSADRQTDDAVSVADMVSTDIICTVL